MKKILLDYLSEKFYLLYDIYLVKEIPKNIIGKTLRGPIKEIANGKEPYIPTTIVRKECIDEIKALYEESEKKKIN